MKNRDKVTLTFGQLKRLIKESTGEKRQYDMTVNQYFYWLLGRGIIGAKPYHFKDLANVYEETVNEYFDGDYDKMIQFLADRVDQTIHIVQTEEAPTVFNTEFILDEIPFSDTMMHWIGDYEEDITIDNIKKKMKRSILSLSMSYPRISRGEVMDYLRKIYPGHPEYIYAAAIDED